VIDVLFVLLPGTLLLDLAGPAEAFAIANQRLRRGGRGAIAGHAVAIILSLSKDKPMANGYLCLRAQLKQVTLP
jgi:transcriptional regulator GlxA family with amidase domain